jgi:hypothetical protein
MLMTLQFALNPGFATGLAHHPRWAVAAGFAVAAYGFVFSAAGVLAAEGPALWLLYSFPRPIHRMLMDRSRSGASSAGLSGPAHGGGPGVRNAR